MGEHGIAGLEIGMPRFQHDRHRAAFHRVAERSRLGIGFPVVHPTAHIGIEREILDTQQHLALLWLRNGCFL